MNNALHTTLLPLALTQESLLDTLILIVLDWERPWTFLRDLKRWLESIRKVVEDIKNEVDKVSQDSRRRKGKYVVEEGQELRRSIVLGFRSKEKSPSEHTLACSGSLCAELSGTTVERCIVRQSVNRVTASCCYGQSVAIT